MADVFDRLGTLISVVMQVNNNKAPQLREYPRPETATARLIKEKARRDHDWLHDRLYPNRGSGDEDVRS